MKQEPLIAVVSESPSRRCTVDGCDSKTVARGLCSKHWRKWRRYGDPTHVRLPRWNGLCTQCGSPGPFHYMEHRCKECNKLATYAGRDRNPERSKKSNARSARLSHQRRRQEVLAAYRGRCACCGESEPAFLAVDHINGGGNAHRRTIGGGRMTGSSNFYRWLVKNGFPSDFQLLCHNCNFAKSHHGGCPHQTAKAAE